MTTVVRADGPVEEVELLWCVACAEFVPDYDTFEVDGVMSHSVREDAPCPGPCVHAVQDGGYVVDESTGLILHHFEAPFRVTDQASAEWVLERLQDAETDAKAVELRRKTINENLDRMASRAARRVEWLRDRFTDELRAWAASELQGRKERTVVTPFGRLSFRRTPGRIVVRPEALSEAVDWCMEHAPQAAKWTPKVLVSELKGREAELPSGLFVVEAPEDRFRVEVRE